MDLTPTESERALRDECRAWLREHLPWEYGQGLPPRFDDLADEVAFGREWQAELAAGRWVGVAWPEEYGGRDAGPVGHYIVTEELARARAPELVGRIGVNLVGPTILAKGTPEQQAQWLPKILSAQELWCQLFSEPDAGSDLASLKTRATRTDGGWLLNGQKVWTSYAQFADWGVCLARTDPDAPKNQGISYLVVDMRDPGVEVRPLHQITDESDFNEVFFSDVFVPADRIIGPEHQGWQVANQTLTHERGVNPRQLVVHTQLVEELLRLANDNGSFDDHRRAQRLAEAFVEVQIFRLHNWRSISRTAKGEAPGPVGTINKVWWSEMSKRLHDTAMTVLGPAAPLWRGANDNPGEGAWQRSWLYYQASSIWAGTNEIQRNLIGERALGLPREPRPTPRSK
ncbi:MAG TPA: acyl-CoA dehydrogenase family protein [Acidimicrobiia bacterium]|jgi:alkylation response protein AidB-like acyl-CoA dehydrogenase